MTSMPATPSWQRSSTATPPIVNVGRHGTATRVGPNERRKQRTRGPVLDRPDHLLRRARPLVAEHRFGPQFCALACDQLGQVVLHFAAGLSSKTCCTEEIIADVSAALIIRGRAAQSVARPPIASNSESTMVAASLAYSSMNAARASAGHHAGIGSCVAYTAAIAVSSSTGSITT